MTHTLSSHVEYVNLLKEFALPSDAIVVADRNLPTWILQHFQGAILVEGGESLKTLKAVESLALEILSRRSTRPITIVALGGGSVGDAVGFLASTLWRGVNLWHIPTTLLAMVDSAHGGKTALNLGEFKNQIGTFYAAENVVICLEILSRLPHEQREEGLAEMLKAMWLDGPERLQAWRLIGTQTLASAQFDAISDKFLALLRAAIELKHKVVAADPFESKSIRTLLNLGHTMAHALELSAGLSHGHAVAWGLAVATEMSYSHHQLSRQERDELLKDVFPLLIPIHEALIPSRAELLEILRRDKKRKDGVLKGVFLNTPGEGFVEDSRAEDWIESFYTIFKWSQAPVILRYRADLRPAFPQDIRPPASKSVLNRMLIVEDLNPRFRVEHGSKATDVVLMQRGLLSLHQGKPVEVGDGGTTFRFLAVRAANIPGSHEFRLSQRLSERPHEDLFAALTRAGARVNRDGQTVIIEGWQTFPTTITVGTDHSSQYATAFSLLAALGKPFTLNLEGKLVSEPYFALTLELLKRIGVRLEARGNSIAFWGFQADLETSLVLRAPMDESSAAVFRALSWLGLAINPIEIEDPHQPDCRLHQYLNSAVEEVDLQDSPDLMPVLATAYAAAGLKVSIDGGDTLELKESNRLQGLRDRLVGVGSEVSVEEKFLVTAPMPEHENILEWDTSHDHRMAFASALASLKGPLKVTGPEVVEKSYPRFWQDLRRLGFTVDPVTFPLDG